MSIYFITCREVTAKYMTNLAAMSTSITGAQVITDKGGV